MLSYSQYSYKHNEDLEDDCGPKDQQNMRRVAIDRESIFRVKNKATSSCALEIAPGTLEGSFMRTF